MQDREVMVTVTMKASQVETVREWFARAADFPKVAYAYGVEIERLMTKEAATPEDGAELGKLVANLMEDARRADMVRVALGHVLKNAVIHDAEGRKGPLQ